MLQLTNHECEVLEGALMELRSLLRENVWPPEDMALEDIQLLTKVANYNQRQHDNSKFDPQI